MVEKKKIIIIEDEIILALELKKYLERIGYIVSSIETNYKDIKNSFKKYLPDLMLLNINLENNKENKNFLEEINKIKKVPFILTSSFTDIKTLKKAVPYNPSAFLVKPVNKEELRINILLAFK
ncbi:response regulator [Halarcobacter mediterraneus]|uniref:response regulator n=1 Tax=Halarcobacter mediterraneus TaxID=2023153 RepID=UPI0013E93F0E|nr:response regulator [Halarcobacter mediterraneus]